ncbi:hypothetical protein WN944_022433 [Citrus x changshan-huyou]|uniref:Uncharacterized protein n=1 Tax=Citrus x changshan-huyou TaxID=2935761 RepID=A0AAP0R371_9ROSI
MLLMKLSLWIGIALIQLHGYKACLEIERIALLEIKSFFASASGVGYDDENCSSLDFYENKAYDSLGSLKQLKFLNLGEIFRSLINYLSNFNESYKNLSGLIPDKKQFGRFDEKSYNLGLCGPTINKSCTRTEENLAITSNRGEDEDESAIKMNPLDELVLALAMVFFH